MRCGYMGMWGGVIMRCGYMGMWGGVIMRCGYMGMWGGVVMRLYLCVHEKGCIFLDWSQKG